VPDDELEKGAVVELLGAPEGEGRQFIVPPSRHRSKGSYVFFGTFEISRIVRLDPAELLRKVRHLGAAALIAEEIRQGGRHELSLHISSASTSPGSSSTRACGPRTWSTSSRPPGRSGAGTCRPHGAT